MDLYLFDFDKTLYGYDFHRRLPALSLATGVSQYDLASKWWAAGYEARAESGEWPDADAYLEKFAEITGATLTIAEWQDARLQAMSRIEGSVAALRRASELGTVSLLTNNPSIFVESLPRLAPDVAAIVGAHLVTSCSLHARKPAAEAYERALTRFGAEPQNTFFTDDNAVNIAAAAALGIHAHHFTSPESLQLAIADFAGRPQ